MSARVHAVIVNFESAQDTIRCARSLATLTTPVDVIVVENASGDSPDTLAAALPDARVLVSDRNLGYAGGNNLGIQAALDAGAEYVLVLNPDVEVVEPTFVDALVAALDADAHAGIVGPRVVDATGRQQPTIERRPSFWAAVSLALRARAGAPKPRSHAGRVPALNGVCLLIRRDTLLATGGFDPAYFMYVEEADLAERAERAGYHCLFVDLPSIVHHHGSGEVRGDGAVGIRANFVRFCLAHRSRTSAAATAVLFLAAARARGRDPFRKLRGALEGVLPSPLRRLVLEELVVPALVVCLVVLLAAGSSRVEPLRRLGSGGKFLALLALTLAGAVVARRFIRRLQRRAGDLVLVSCVVFVAVAVASIGWSDDPQHSFRFTVAIVLLLAGAFAVPWSIVQRPARAVLLAEAVLLGVAIVVVLDALSVVDRSGSFVAELGTARRFRGILESANTIAAYSFLTPLALWWLTRPRRAAARLIGAAVLLAFLVEIALSGTRLALALVMLTAALYVVGAYGGRRGALIATVSVLVLAAGVTVLATSRRGSDAGLPSYVRPSSIPTLSGRTEAWTAAANIILGRPLTGYGVGQESAVFVRYQAEQLRAADACEAVMPPSYCGSAAMRWQRLADFSGEYVHNSFLGLGIQLGAVVAGLWTVVLLFAVGAAAWAVRPRERLRPALIAAVVGALIWAFYSTYLWSPGNIVAAVFWLLLAGSLARDPEGLAAE